MNKEQGFLASILEHFMNKNEELTEAPKDKNQWLSKVDMELKDLKKFDAIERNCSISLKMISSMLRINLLIVG